jgi:hypothetical protein
MTERENKAKASSNGIHKNGRRKKADFYIVNPASASELRKDLRITPSQTRNILRAFHAVGVKV